MNLPFVRIPTSISMTSAEPARFPLQKLLRADPRLTGWLGLLFALAIWVLSRPYRGLRHDGLLYAGQLLSHLYPERFRHDVFFLFGSQDRFSAFSRLVVPLVARFGLAETEIVLLITCQVSFVVAIWILAGRYARPTRWLAVLCATVFPHTYASHNIFGFAENFLTARSIAEPLALLALVALLCHKTLLAVALLVLSALVHPLMALPVILIAWIMKARADRRWLWAGALVLPVLALAAMGVAPFDGLFRRFDGAWWAEVCSVTNQVTITAWDSFDWMSLVMDVGLLLMGSRGDHGRMRDLNIASLYAIGTCFAIDLVGVDLLHNVLLSGLQLWRVLWIGHLLALMCLPIVMINAWRSRGQGGQLVAGALAAALLAIGANLDQAWLLLLWFGATLLLQRFSPSISRSTYRLAIGATIVTIALVTFVTVLATWRVVVQESDASRLVAPGLAIFSLPVMALFLSAVLMGVIRACPTPVAVLLLCIVGATSALHWDQRSAWQKFVEAGERNSIPFARLIPPSATVFWPDNVEATWFVLKRSHFVAPEQGAGMVFNRDTAMEFKRRTDATTPFNIQRGLCQVVGSFTGGTTEDLERCSPTPDVVAAICHAPVHPDFMVFPLELDKGRVDSWTFTSTLDKPKHLYLYDCSRI